jgi:hypothetical protein
MDEIRRTERPYGGVIPLTLEVDEVNASRPNGLSKKSDAMAVSVRNNSPRCLFLAQSREVLDDSTIHYAPCPGRNVRAIGGTGLFIAGRDYADPLRTRSTIGSI